MKSSLEPLWKTHETINSWIHSTNTKAEIILGINGIITSVFLTSNLEELKTYLANHSVLYIPLCLGALSTLVSVLYSVRCINPTLKVGEPQSLIYFAHIAHQFDRAPSYERTVREKLVDDDYLLHDLSSQVWANAKVATSKFHYVTLAIRWLVVTVVSGIFSVILALILL